MLIIFLLLIQTLEMIVIHFPNTENVQNRDVQISADAEIWDILVSRFQMIIIVWNRDKSVPISDTPLSLVDLDIRKNYI